MLSGMNSLEMVEENVRNADTARVGEFTEKEEALLKKVVQAINANMKVGCTGCGYCKICPQKVDIPGTFSAYNKYYADGWFTALHRMRHVRTSLSAGNRNSKGTEKRPKGPGRTGVQNSSMVCEIIF